MQIVTTTPSNKAVNVSTIAQIVVTYDVAVDVDTVDNSSITVSTKKPNILKQSGNFVQPDNLFGSDAFFTDAFTAVVEGTVTVSDKVVTFTPKTRYQPNTEYTVYISNNIKGQDASSLLKIASLTFTTAAQDMVDPLPDVPTEERIIGTNLIFANNNTSLFQIASTNPKNNSFLMTRDKIVIRFSEEVKSAAGIQVFAQDIFSDYEPEELEATASFSGKTVTITLPSVNLDNKIVTVAIPEGFESLSGKKFLSEYTFSYVALLTPYYASTKLVRLLAGSVLTDVTDIQIALMLHFASIDADALLSKRTMPGVIKARLKEKWALWNAVYNILSNNHRSDIADFVKKDLGEFSLSVSSKSRITLYNKLLDQAKQTISSIKQLLNYSYSNTSFVRSGLNRTSDIGRLWDRDDRKPGLNSRTASGVKYKLDWNENYIVSIGSDWAE